ncbi:tRNA (adenine(22)-N(1))-methyltransferase [Dendrosporobacter sp. 1207_IL3150]|uniref:tRNA (adenine(22)-N(1))-methyltransferase n=1 Tax=Dendrosporobacter sp. 1207_IL3150 TaxID=3084054 RepID=UPI002FDB24F1
MKLGERLTAVASLIPKNTVMADIGTDHAYLPIYLLKSNIIRSAVAGEVNKGPYHAAKETIEYYGAVNDVSLRLGDGLDVIRPNEVDVVVIAGMGGGTIVDILEKSPETAKSLQQIILQPMNASATLRKWLVENGWFIADELLVKEDERLYEIISAKQGKQIEIEPILFDIGPVLWSSRSVLLKEHIENLILQAKRILKEMDASEQAKKSEKYQQYAQKIRELEMKLECL